MTSTVRSYNEWFRLLYLCTYDMYILVLVLVAYIKMYRHSDLYDCKFRMCV